MILPLQGLEGLTNIAGSLNVHENDVLVALQGVDGLKTVGGAVRIVDARRP